MVHLTWFTARRPNIVIHRNGKRLATTQNDGYRDDNVRGLTGPFRYKVSEQSHAKSCSAEISVSF